MSAVVIVGKILDFEKLDRQGEVITADCAIELEQEVGMYHEWDMSADAMLGLANLERKQDGIYAKMKFWVEDPVKMALIKKLKPCIGGTVYQKDSVDIFGIQDESRIKTSIHFLKAITINKIGICLLNADYGIKTLEEMENESRA